MLLLFSEVASLTRSAWLRVTDDTGEILAEFENPDDLNAWLSAYGYDLAEPPYERPGYIPMRFIVVGQENPDNSALAIEGE